jgi:hypothetical protein
MADAATPSTIDALQPSIQLVVGERNSVRRETIRPAPSGG